MIGNQDITAQVDFTSIGKSGEQAGLNSLGLVTQREFLSNLGLATLQRRLSRQNLSPRQMLANQAGILDLVKPGGLGDFKMLIQEKNVGAPKLWGVEHSEKVASLANCLSVPLLTDRHLALLDVRSFGGDPELETFWTSSEFESLG